MISGTEDGLFGFSPDSFEQFARALAVAVLGPGVKAFGNGPDGGREATFHGSVGYPHPPTSAWNGYGVIQAKCKEKRETTQKDQEWAIKELHSELKLFASNSRRNPKPEYYIFITNVSLTSSTAGGKEKADDIASSFYSSLPLKGHAIWDAEQISTYLSLHDSLRRSFRAFLTPGDVLSSMLDQIERNRPDASRIFTTFLEKELRADQAAKLDQAGNRTDEQLQLASVFFDLPASKEPSYDPPDEEANTIDQLPHGVLFEMLRAASRKLDPSTLFRQENTSSETDTPGLAPRYVLLGGPGSGKSTLSQFIAQIHRAALLKRCDQALLEPSTRKTIEAIERACIRAELPWPATPRYAFRIDLNRFAKALASQEQGSVPLARYLRNLLQGQDELSHDDLLRWLSTYPSMLVLDGLDEVPSTSNRASVVSSINDFFAETRQAGCDLFVVATSRHQGYSGEFLGDAVATRHILPLSPARALAYVRTYTDARFSSSNPQKAADVVARLQESTKRKLTAQLMSTPLQVTFMATVVAARGDPGEDRWQLFDSYYRTIYDRERQKAVPPYDQVLSKHQPTIDRLHHDIGFLLQRQGELTGGTSSTLAIRDFEALVDAYLAEDGYSGPDKKELVALTTEAARERLVFLTSRIAGELAFDVRSLQEYMAAECLTSGRPELVELRLNAIAAAPYWRNVFLFAASKCFVDARSRHLQRIVGSVCEDLNSPSDQILHLTKAGSELALDVLQSGAVAQNPKNVRSLSSLALRTLRHMFATDGREDAPSISQRLAAGYSPFAEDLYYEEIVLLLQQTEVLKSAHVWPLMVRLSEAGYTWTQRCLSDFRTLSYEDLCRLGPSLQFACRSPIIRIHIAKVILSKKPSDAFKFFRALHMFPHFAQGILGALARIYFGDDRMFIPILDDSNEVMGITINVVSLSSTTKLANTYRRIAKASTHPDWRLFNIVSTFLDDPALPSLANALRSLADETFSIIQEVRLYLPWPIALLVGEATSQEDLHDLANQIREKAYTQSCDFVLLENKWKKGIAIHSILPCAYTSALDLLLGDGAVARVGFPSIACTEYTRPQLMLLKNAAMDAPSGRAREMLAMFLCVAGRFSKGLEDICTPDELRDLISATNTFWSESLVGVPKEGALVDGWVDFLSWVGQSSLLSPFYEDTYSSELFPDLDTGWLEILQTRLLTASPEGRSGLLRLLGRIASSGRSVGLITAQQLDLRLYPDTRDQLSCLLIRISQPTFTEKEGRDAAPQAFTYITTPAEENAHVLFFRALERHLQTSDGAKALLLNLIGLIPDDLIQYRSKCERLLRVLATARPSAFASTTRLCEYELPQLRDQL